VKAHHAWMDNIPKYLCGHKLKLQFAEGMQTHNKGKHSTKETKEKISASLKEHYSNYDNWKKHKATHSRPEVRHKISASIKAWHVNPANKKKFQAAIRNPRRLEKINYARKGKSVSDVAKENFRLSKGTVDSGPDWFLTFRDFIKTACRLYEIQYMRASRLIRQALERKRLERFDVILFLNFIVGHTQFELSEQYGVDVEVVTKSLKKMHRTFPGVFQEQISAPPFPTRCLYEWEDVHEKF